ncbi:kinetochore-associated protein 1-like isoform X2 [Ptychodera flava]|uniref:kinetochore-associated protein 1-like isoform X2 n=1 Tax=Ptychodera flava TaxID=63121 RepID=UPI00396A48F7
MLAEFSQETSSSITFRMLDRVAAPELIPKAIVTMVRPYIKQHKLSKEELLFKYIEDLIERSGNMSSYSYEASWEDRAVAVIKCIKDLDYFCQALQSLMLKAALPWSDLVENIVKQGLAVDHPRVSQLKQHYKVVELRIMLLKYDIHNYNTSDESRACTLWKFLLSQDTETSLADALQVTTVYSREKAEDVYMFRLRYLIEHQKVAECIDLLKCISSEESLICAKRLLIWIQIILQEKEDTDCIDNEYEANEELIHDECREKMVVTEASLSVIRFVLDKDELKPAEFEELKRMLSDLKCIHCLQEEYGKFLSLEDYREEPVREMHLRDYMVSVLSGKLTGPSVKVCPGDLERKPGQAKNFTYNKIYRLAELLRVTADQLNGQLAIQAARNGQVELAIKMCKEMYELVPDEKIGEVFYTVAHTLCKVQAESEVNDPENQWFSKEIHELACQAAIICSPDLLADCQELCRCTRLANQVYQQCENEEYGITIQVCFISQTLSADSQMSVHQKDPFEDWTFCDFYEEDSLVLDSNYAMPLANQFTLCCLPKIHSIDDRQPLQQDNIVGIAEHQIEPDMEQHMIQSISQCTSDLVSLLQENSLALSYVLKTMLTCAGYTTRRLMGFPTEEKADRLDGIMKPIYGYGSRMVQQYSLNLLHKVLGSKKVDVELASEYALMIPYKVAVDKLQSICTSSGHNYGKIIDISRVGKAVALSNSDQQLLSYYERLCTKAEWGHRLNQLQISFSDAFNSDQSTDYQNVLPKMLLHGKNDRQMFKDYCRDFNLNVDDALLLYLEMLLLPSQDQMQTKAAKPPPIDEFVVECVLELIQNKNALQIKLSRILDKLDFYDYERIDFVMVQIMSSCKLNPEEKQTVEMGLKLLSYLSVYTRCSKPSQYEIMYRYKTEEDQLLHGSETLPEMSKTRLPFHPLLYGSPWKIIIPELDASTVSSLQPIAEVLKLLPDQMNMIAIKNEMDKVLKQWELQERTLGESSDDTGWNSNKRLDLKTLENFKTLFMNIKDCEMSVAAARYVAKQLPRGPDQVMVLKFCTMLACRWKDSTQSDPKTNEIATHTYDKLTDVYKRLSTEQVLYKYNLADPAYLMLANNPARLIFQLYEHKSIEERGSAHSTDFPDIHTAADKIAAATDCTVQKIRQILFDKWMPPQICKTDTSDDILFDSEPIEMTEDERSFRRVVYLLQYGEVEQNASSLVKSISEHSGLSIASRVRAIRCLFALLKDRDIEKIALVSASKLRECLQTYLYMTQLETLNITMSVDEFTSCNKVELVRRLWRNHNHEPKAVRLISDLCLQYKINDIQLWNGLLQQFLVFNTMNYLKYVIVKLSAIQELWQVPCLVRSWRSVILQPLTAVSPPLNDEQEKVCHESLLLLLCCPVISDMDMIEFSRQFLRLQMTSHALACLLLVSHTEKKKRQIQTLLSSGCHAVILDQIHKLSLKRLFLPQIDQIVSTVFDNIVCTENYATLMSTPHCEAFQNYLAKTKNIDGMLCKLLETNGVEDGVKLVNLYYQHNAETPPANQSAKNTMKEGTLKLKIYLETHHLLDKLECDEAELRDHLDV